LFFQEKKPNELDLRLRELNGRLAPEGLKVDWDVGSAFGKDLCGYSALLAARELAALKKEGSTTEKGIIHVTVTSSEAMKFFRFLRASLESFNIVINAPLEADHLEPIAQQLRICIILEVGTSYKAYSNYTRVFNPDASETVRMFLFVDHDFGHYQIITPQNVEVHYVDDCHPFRH
jgi:hypothetical protein